MGRHRPRSWVGSGLGESSRGTFHPVGTGQRRVDHQPSGAAGRRQGSGGPSDLGPDWRGQDILTGSQQVVDRGSWRSEFEPASQLWTLGK